MSEAKETTTTTKEEEEENAVATSTAVVASQGDKKKVVFTTDNPYLTRPARKQAKKGSGPIRQEIQHHSSDYNIWYHKKLGDRFEKEERVKALTRCNIAKDAGYTRADINKKDTYFCLYFARGHCTNGSQCNFYHKIPTEEDELRNDIAHDIFGRERHRTYRDDMGGVGSFMRENRTLHITGFQRGRITDEILRKHFGEWGEIEYARIVWDKAMAFVRYTLRASAEFAKEAMTDQSLENNEVLSIRWANEDPNPKARQDDETRKKNLIAKVVNAKRAEKDPLYFYEQGSTEGALDHYPPEHQSETAYPNTDAQFQANTYSDGTKFVGDLLQTLNLEQYTTALLSGGYFDRQSLAHLDDIGLDAVGITNQEHRFKLLNAVSELQAALQQQQQDEAAQAQSYSAQSYYYDPYLYTNPEYTGEQQYTGEGTYDYSSYYSGEYYTAPSASSSTATQSAPIASTSKTETSAKKQTGGGLVAYGSDEDE